ncbi:MAG: aldo/keto reductase [Clostridia bacterium]|nr:aldo/keto reductase [Clostridia bacterium]
MSVAIKKLGFGLMRLPKTEDDKFDMPQIKEMVDRFLAAGYTYFDTAWAYEGSETTIREALVDRYPRESFCLATKNAAWIKCNSREDAIAQFETSLKLTNAGYFDYYLLHNLGANRTELFEKFGLWDFFLEKKKEGLIRHLGFSFHDTADKLDAILTAHPEAEFVQLQINYADWESPTVQSRLCYETARRHGKPVVVMEPVKGGLLADPPAAVKEVFDADGLGLSYAARAVRFAASREGVLTVLSGMSSIGQMEDNLKAMEGFERLSETESASLDAAREVMARMPLIPCTNCKYCMKVCPAGIGIPGLFAARNGYTLYQNITKAKNDVHWATAAIGLAKPDACLECGACEDACPQHIGIRDRLKELTDTLGIE